jgi:prevent-host-death family protein
MLGRGWRTERSIVDFIRTAYRYALTTIRRDLCGILKFVREENEIIIITRKKKDIAVIISVHDFNLFQTLLKQTQKSGKSK